MSKEKNQGAKRILEFAQSFLSEGDKYELASSPESSFDVAKA